MSPATPAGANPAVVAATEAVENPQVVSRGGDPAEAVAGEQPAGLSAVIPIISDGTGTVINANELNKVDEAVEAATRGAGGKESGALDTAASTEATKVGTLIAQAFQAELDKTAQDQEYINALQILNDNGLLEGYQINDNPMTKTASVTGTGLDKLANKEKMERADIISAAYELIDLEKQAELVEEQGRQQARDLVAFVTKLGADTKEEAAAEDKTETEEKDEDKEKKDEEKVAALMQKPEIVNAVRILKENDLL
jgi:hypothetical protein